MNTFNNPMLPLSAFVVSINGKDINALVRKHSGFDSFAELVATNKSYRPSIGCYARNQTAIERMELLAIANAYDCAMIDARDSRRAYRY